MFLDHLGPPMGYAANAYRFSSEPDPTVWASDPSLLTYERAGRPSVTDTVPFFFQRSVLA